MKTFKLEFDIENASFADDDGVSMESARFEIARILDKISKDIHAGRDCCELPQKVRDFLGNTVGHYIIEE